MIVYGTKKVKQFSVKNFQSLYPLAEKTPRKITKIPQIIIPKKMLAADLGISSFHLLFCEYLTKQPKDTNLRMAVNRVVFTFSLVGSVR